MAKRGLDDVDPTGGLGGSTPDTDACMKLLEELSEQLDPEPVANETKKNSSKRSKAAQPVNEAREMIPKPIYVGPDGNIWTGVPTAIVGDSMLRGQEIKQYFWWARCHVFQDLEALCQKPPADCQRVFYVSSGNALCSHRVRFADSALKNMRTEAFLKKIGGVILLGSVDLWERLYAPTRPSGKLVNPTFFDEVKELCLELNVPLKQLDDDCITNLNYTSDVHPQPGPTRTKLAQHVEKHLVELSQSAAEEAGGADEGWIKQFKSGKKTCTQETCSSFVGQPGCKWCKRGECWTHSPTSYPDPQAMMRMQLMSNMMDQTWWGAW